MSTDQLALALSGDLDYVWAVSLIVTNIPANAGDCVGIEAWFRHRTSIEERFRAGKLGAGLNRLPSASVRVHLCWMWAGFFAGATNVMIRTVTGLDRDPNHPGRARIATLRHRLHQAPGRIIHRARGLTLRLAPGQHTLPAVLARLGKLPAT